MVLWGNATNEIHYIPTCICSLDTKLGNVLTYHERLPPLKILWSKRPTWGHMTNWKICISAFARLMTTKPGRMLALRMRFTMWMLTLSPSSCHFFLFSFTLFCNRLAKVFCKCFVSCSSGRVWPVQNITCHLLSCHEL